MAIKTIQENNLTWVSIDEVDEEALTFLKTNYHFHPLDLEDIQADAQNPKIDVYKNYLFLVLHFPQWSHEEKKITSQQVDFFVTDNALITIQHHRNKDIKSFFYRCQKNRRIKAEWMSGTSGYLLYFIIEALFQESRPILNNMGKHISVIEQEVFSGDQGTLLIRDLSVHRRNVLAVARIIEPQRYLISNLSHIRKPFLDESLSIYFDDVRDYLDRLWAIVESYKETVHGLYITVESFINQRTNKVLTIMTIISVALLPHTLFFNFYGMNLDLPFHTSQTVVWTLLGVLTIGMVGGLIFTLRRMRRSGWF